MATERNRMDAASIDWSFAASQAHLPPRSPLFGSGNASGMSENNGSFGSTWPKVPLPSTHANRRHHHQRTPSTSFLPQTPTWVDDLLNDSMDVPPPKNLHRRSSSDSLAFLEAPPLQQQVQITNEAEDEEEPESMAHEDRLLSVNKMNEEWALPKLAGGSGANTRASSSENKSLFEASSAPSDRDSLNESSMVEEEKAGKGTGSGGQSKNDAEVESALKTVQSPPLPAGKGESLWSSPADTTSLDPKRTKRILANRQSAQRSRVRKLQYIAELERTVNLLQEEVSALSPQVSYLDRHRIVLNVDNSAMKQRIAAMAQEKLFKDAHNEALKVEVHRLRQLYQQQQKLASSSSSSSQQPPPGLHTLPQLELKDLDIGIDVAKCVEYVFKENDADLLGSHLPCPRLPLLNKPIGPSSCSSSEKGTGSSSGLEQLHSDFRIQN